MTGWTLFLILVGVGFLTAQLFRVIDLIERPARRAPAACRRTIPPAWNILLRNALRDKSWTFWKN